MGEWLVLLVVAVLAVLLLLGSDADGKADGKADNESSQSMIPPRHRNEQIDLWRSESRRRLDPETSRRRAEQARIGREFFLPEEDNAVDSGENGEVKPKIRKAS